MRIHNLKNSVFFTLLFLFILFAFYIDQSDDLFSNSYTLGEVENYNLTELSIHNGEVAEIKINDVKGEFKLIIVTSNEIFRSYQIVEKSNFNFKVDKNAAFSFLVNSENSFSFSIVIEIHGFGTGFAMTIAIILFLFIVAFIIEFAIWRHQSFVYQNIDSTFNYNLQVKFQSFWKLKGYIKEFVDMQYSILLLIPFLLVLIFNSQQLDLVYHYHNNQTNMFEFSKSKFIWNVAREYLLISLLCCCFLLPVLNFREFTLKWQNHPDHRQIYPYQRKYAIISRIVISFWYIFVFSSVFMILKVLLSNNNLGYFTYQILSLTVLLTIFSLICIICIYYLLWYAFESPTLSLIVFPFALFNIIFEKPFRSSSNKTLFSMEKIDAYNYFTPNLSQLLIFRFIIMMLLLTFLLLQEKLQNKIIKQFH